MAESLIFAKVSGDREAVKALDDLRMDLRRNVIRAALRDASRPFVLEARRQAPELSEEGAKRNKRRQRGTLRRNIKVFSSKKYNGANGVIGVYVTVKASKADLRTAPITGDPYYWRWVAGGHKIVARFKGKYEDLPLFGQRRLTGISIRRRAATQMVRPYPFLSDAFTAKGRDSLTIFESRIGARIAKAEARSL